MESRTCSLLDCLKKWQPDHTCNCSHIFNKLATNWKGKVHSGTWQCSTYSSKTPVDLQSWTCWSQGKCLSSLCNNNNNNLGTCMALNLNKTIQSTLTRSYSQTLATYTNNNNMPTVHAWTWINENSQERGKTYRREKNVLRFDLNVLRVGVWRRGRGSLFQAQGPRARANSRKLNKLSLMLGTMCNSQKTGGLINSVQFSSRWQISMDLCAWPAFLGISTRLPDHGLSQWLCLSLLMRPTLHSVFFPRIHKRYSKASNMDAFNILLHPLTWINNEHCLTTFSYQLDATLSLLSLKTVYNAAKQRKEHVLHIIRGVYFVVNDMYHTYINYNKILLPNIHL